MFSFELSFSLGNVGTGELKESMMVYPNPVEDLVNVRFRVTDNGSTWLGIYSLDGKELQVIVNKSMPKGDYNYMTSLGYLPSGEYIAVLRKKDLPVASKIIIKK